MPRPRKLRFVQGRPIVGAFVPDAIPPWGREEAVLPVEGLEAIRLSDLQGMDQETAAKMMNVSRQTFGRILSDARMIVADALVGGKVLRIEGGHFEMPPWGRGRHRRGWTIHRGSGYHGIYGEATKHVLEASVLSVPALHDRMGSRCVQCLRCFLWAIHRMATRGIRSKLG